MRLFAEFLVMTLAGGILGGFVTSTLGYCAAFPITQDPFAVVQVAWPMGFFVGAVLGLAVFIGKHGGASGS